MDLFGRRSSLKLHDVIDGDSYYRRSVVCIEGSVEVKFNWKVMGVLGGWRLRFMALAVSGKMLGDLHCIWAFENSTSFQGTSKGSICTWQRRKLKTYIMKGESLIPSFSSLPPVVFHKNMCKGKIGLSRI